MKNQFSYLNPAKLSLLRKERKMIFPCLKTKKTRVGKGAIKQMDCLGSKSEGKTANSIMFFISVFSCNFFSCSASNVDFGSSQRRHAMTEHHDHQHHLQRTLSRDHQLRQFGSRRIRKKFKRTKKRQDTANTEGKAYDVTSYFSLIVIFVVEVDLMR